MPKSTSNSCCANATFARSRNAMTYISIRNGSSRLNTFLVAASLRSWRRRAASCAVSSVMSCLLVSWIRDRSPGGRLPGRDLPSVHVLRAVDLDGGPVDVAGPVGQQECDGRGD